MKAARFATRRAVWPAGVWASFALAFVTGACGGGSTSKLPKVVDAAADAPLDGLGDERPPADAASETAADAGTDGDADAHETGDAACAEVSRECTPKITPPSECDPGCDTCGCGKTCRASIGGAAYCYDVSGTVPVGGRCVTGARDLSCVPGATCIVDGCGGEFCAQFCKRDADCVGGAKCSQVLDLTSFPICDILPTTCDPTGAAQCPDGKSGCYILGFSGDDTGCDCPGPLRNGEECGSNRECAPGLLCTPTNLIAHICRPVCDTRAPTCPSGAVCKPYPDSRWGWCEPGLPFSPGG